MLLADDFKNVITMMLFGNKDKNQAIPIPKDAQGRVLGNGYLYTDVLESNKENPTIKPFQKDSKYRITSTFGRRSDLKNREPHSGIDICFSQSFSMGEFTYKKPPLFSPIDGQIIFNEKSSSNSVYIVDKDKNKHGLLHMDVVFVQNGQKVKQGDLVGIIGGIGKSLSNIDNQQVNTIYDNVLKLQEVDYFQAFIDFLKNDFAFLEKITDDIQMQKAQELINKKWQESITKQHKPYIDTLHKNGIQAIHLNTLLKLMERKDLGDKKEQIIKNEIIRHLRNKFAIHLHYQIQDSKDRLLNPAVFWNTAYKIKETHCDEQEAIIQTDGLNKIYEYSYDKNSNLLEIKTPKGRRFFPYFTSEKYYTLHNPNTIKENLGLYYTAKDVDSRGFRICEYFLQEKEKLKQQILLYRRYKNGKIDSKNKDQQDSYNNWFQVISGTANFKKVDVELELMYYQWYKRNGILGQAPEQKTENPNGTVTISLTLSNQQGLLQNTPIYIYSYFHHKIYESKTDEYGLLCFCLSFEESNKSFTLALHCHKEFFNMDTSSMVGNITKITLAPSHIQGKEYIGHKTIQDFPKQESKSNTKAEVIQNMPYEYYFDRRKQ